MNSCIYVGQVRHRRFVPKQYNFHYSLFMVYLDLTELPVVFSKRWAWSTKHFSLAWFRRKDHFGDPSMPLDLAVRDLVEKQTNIRPGGPIRLLTHLRYFGYCFNPVSFFYCYNEQDTHVETIVAEVNNTPWGERHCYVLNNANQIQPNRKHYVLKKEFHVSPFMDMQQNYDWRFSQPDKKLAIHMQNFMQEGKQKLFDATLTLQRRELSSLALAGTLARFPFMTGKVIFGIYYQALKMWLRKFPLYTHSEDSQGNFTHLEAPDSAK